MFIATKRAKVCSTDTTPLTFINTSGVVQLKLGYL
jgi:hypothetical protein